mgnify:CR=1 FL=1
MKVNAVPKFERIFWPGGSALLRSLAHDGEERVGLGFLVAPTEPDAHHSGHVLPSGGKTQDGRGMRKAGL